jgi:hypothetical protein
MDKYWYIGSDNLIAIEDLTDALTDAEINDAEIVGNVVKTDTPATSLGTIAFSAVGSGGCYNGTLSNTVSAAFTAGAIYTVTVTITKNTLKSIFKMTRTAAYLSA